MYRPDDWKNPYSSEPIPSLAKLSALENSEGFKTLTREAYEAGADAMLEALTSQQHQDWLATQQGESCKGKWLFIPED